MAQEWHTRSRHNVLGIVVTSGFVGLVGFGIVTDCRAKLRSDERTALEKRQRQREAATVAIDAAVPPPVTLEQRVAGALSLSDALALAKPISTTLIARYAIAKLRFAEVDAEETNLALVEKDFEAELGKRMCASGEILRIERTDMERRKAFVGELLTKEQDRVMFLAVGSTGELLKRSQARFCGVVTDKLQLVGMFDLAENRTTAVEQ